MKFLLFLLFFSTCFLQAQNTVSFQEGKTSPDAKISDIAWLSGSWEGEAFGGIAEEIWSPPMDGSMMFSFRLAADGAVSFYEFGHIVEIDGTLLLELKHFDANLSGWEEKDENIEFKLVKIDENRFYFDDFTIEYVSDQEVNMYVQIGEEDGSSSEILFNYHRQ